MRFKFTLFILIVVWDASYAQDNTAWSLYGNIGVGTTIPIDKFSVGSSIHEVVPLSVGTTSTGYGNGGVLNFRGAGGGIINAVRGTYTNSPGDHALLEFQTFDGDLSTRMAINGKNIGIGTSVPNRLLTVSGNSGLNVKSSSGAAVNLNYLYGTDIPALYSLTSVGSVSHLAINPEGGNVGIGTTTPTEKLAVNGKIRAKEINVETGWSDFVFEPHYKLLSLKETEDYIKRNKHLPEIPSAKEVEKEGINVGEMNAKLLQKIEELTLYIIDQNKRIENLEGKRRKSKH